MIRKAIISDAPTIQELVARFSQKGIMLPRSLNSVYEHIRDFWVIEEDHKVIGCAALHVVGWNGLAEIRSLSVNKERQKKGMGKQLIDKCIEEALEIGVEKVFALTFVPEFFLKYGFTTIEKETLPHKIWSDCIDCPFFPDCKEVAVMKTL
jgi:amino-acid N-acetyltransferase